eukprot:6205386-Pleurochrysis_carterae.AAC.3
MNKPDVRAERCWDRIKGAGRPRPVSSSKAEPAMTLIHSAAATIVTVHSLEYDTMMPTMMIRSEC